MIRPCTIRTQLFDQEGGEIIPGKMQPQPAVIVAQPYIIANGGSIITVGVKATRSLGITQIVIGSLTFLFGILNTSLVNFWVGYVGFAIWGGVWVSPIFYFVSDRITFKIIPPPLSFLA